MEFANTLQSRSDDVSKDVLSNQRPLGDKEQRADQLSGRRNRHENDGALFHDRRITSTEHSSRLGSHPRSDSRHFPAKSSDKTSRTSSKAEELAFWKVKAACMEESLLVAEQEMTGRPTPSFEEVIITRTLLRIWKEMGEGMRWPIGVGDSIDVPKDSRAVDLKLSFDDDGMEREGLCCLVLDDLQAGQEEELFQKMAVLLFIRNAIWTSSRERSRFFSVPDWPLLAGLSSEAITEALLVTLDASKVEMIKDLEVAFQKIGPAAFENTRFNINVIESRVGLAFAHHMRTLILEEEHFGYRLQTGVYPGARQLACFSSPASLEWDDASFSDVMQVWLREEVKRGIRDTLEDLFSRKVYPLHLERDLASYKRVEALVGKDREDMTAGKVHAFFWCTLNALRGLSNRASFLNALLDCYGTLTRLLAKLVRRSTATTW